MNSLSMTFEDFFPFDANLSDNQAYFIVSHHVNANEYETKKISINNLVKSLSLDMFNLRSASHAESSDFALSSHDHDIYTSAYYNNALTGSDVLPILSIYDITHNTSSVVNVNQCSSIDEISITAKDLPKLGTIQMVAISSLSYFDNVFSSQSSGFVGWTLANGNEYQLSDFVMSNDISNVFECNNEKFIVPNLNSFCRILTDISGNNSSYDIVNGQSYTPLHVHSIQQTEDNNVMQIYSNNISVDDSSQLCTLLTLYASNTNNNNIYVNLTNVQKGNSCTVQTSIGLSSFGKNCTLGAGQAGPPSGKPNAKYPIYSETYSCPAEFSTTSLQNLNILLSTGTNDEISYPSHMLMPTLIYVGPSRFSSIQIEST